MEPANCCKRSVLLTIIMTVLVCWGQAGAGEISLPGAPSRAPKEINFAEINHQAISGGSLRFAEVEIVTSERFSVEDISALASAPGSDLEVLSEPSRVKVQLPAGEVQSLIDAGAEVTVVREFLLFEGFAGSEEMAGSDPAVNATCTGDYLYDISESDVTIPANGDWAYSTITLSGAPDKAEVTCIDVHVEIKDYASSYLYMDLTDEDFGEFEYILYNDNYTGDNLLSDYGVTAFNGRLANQIWFVWASNDNTGAGGKIDRWWIKVYYHVPEYCSAMSTNCVYEYISNVEVGDISNATDCEFYADYTDMSTAMDIGTGYGITVTNGYPDASDECGIWVDWNQDGDFEDASETISVSGSPGVGPYTATITPPETATAGDCRLRVRLCYDVTPNPCGTCEYGDVEDYTISVTGGPTTFTIAGNVSSGAEPIRALEGVTMSGLPGDPATDINGDYTATVDAGWSGTVSPTKAQWSFIPRDYTNVQADALSEDWPGNATECYNSSAPDYAWWAANGMPDCWCYRKQCHGDANGEAFLGKWVTVADNDVLKAAFGLVVLPPNGACADFNHEAFLGKRVTVADNDILKLYFGSTAVPDCDGIRVNAWTN